jgi:hypothetical protein
VIGGTGAFVVAARDFRSFADAILRKLAQEIAEAPNAQMQPALRCSKSGLARSR